MSCDGTPIKIENFIEQASKILKDAAVKKALSRDGENKIKTVKFSNPLSEALPKKTVFRRGTIRRRFTKVGRNEICPFCGSGKKFKLCCGRAK